MTVKSGKGRKTSWADIFANTDKYGDDMVITLKTDDGEEVTHSLGDLRTYNTEHDGELTQKLDADRQEIEKDKRNVEAAREEVLSIYRAATGEDYDASKLADKVKKGKKVNAAEVSDATGIDENDPIMGPLVREINAMKGDGDAKFKAISDNVAKLQGVMGKVLSTYLEDGYKAQFSGLSTQISKLPKKSQERITFDALKKFAADNHISDKEGRLDLNRALRDFAYDDIREVEFEERYQARKKKDDDEARMRTVTHPTRPGSQHEQTIVDVKKSKDPLGDAFNAAMDDTDMWNGIFNEQTA